jgi:hypothetical protein
MLFQKLLALWLYVSTYSVNCSDFQVNLTIIYCFPILCTMLAQGTAEYDFMNIDHKDMPSNSDSRLLVTRF